jgi:sugar (pentulose or hexulose) kinase
MNALYLGIDFGTSGSRAIIINADRQIQAQVQLRYGQGGNQQSGNQQAQSGQNQSNPNQSNPNQHEPSRAADCEHWRSTLFELLSQLPLEYRNQVQAIAINGTSSTVLLADAQGQVSLPPMLYNDARGSAVLDQVKAIAPPHHTVISATSSLTKLFWLLQTSLPSTAQPLYFLHQADWLAFLLHGQLGVSDYHNALKLGYDVENLRYPDWLQRLVLPVQLPQVLAPGTPIAPVLPEIADRFGFSSQCMVCAGTTDSIAAFLASGASFPGEAVTSLGSTLVLKLLSETHVDDARYGIYSHRFGNFWLVGGASNTGGAVLKQFFSDDELQQLSLQIPLDRPSPLNYYPLIQPGERFPYNDPHRSPQLNPRPENPVEFLHGLLESIARIEAKGYQLLQDLGATPLQRVYTAGGGARNQNWTAIRSRYLAVPVLASVQTEAAYGTALLAARWNVLDEATQLNFNLD